MNVGELIEHLRRLEHQDATVTVFFGKQTPSGAYEGPEYELAEIVELEADPEDDSGYLVLPPDQPTDHNVVTIRIGLRAQTEGTYVLDVSAEK